MNATELKRLLQTLQGNLNILQEREAKFGGNAPLELLNQIQDHRTAIAVVEARLRDDLSDEELERQLAPLNLSLDRGGTVISGKNVIQIGALTIPVIPMVVAAVGLIGLLAFVSYRIVVPAPVPTATPVQGPVQMAGLFNVAVAQFGQVDAAGQVQPSVDGRQLSRRIYEALRLEFDNLPVDLRQEFQPLLWHDTLPPEDKGVTIGIIPGASTEARTTSAAKLAQEINANVIIYGNLVLNQNTASFVPEFYVASLHGEADEIVGRHQLGAPISLQLPLNLDQQAGLSLNKKLVSRTRALSRFTLGLMYDLGGFSQDARQVFQLALQELDWDSTGGREVFYYFLGRSALFLNDDQEAQTAFEQAQASNPGYARPFVGLGSVSFKRAQCQLLDAAESDQAYNEVCRRKDGSYIAPCQGSGADCLGQVRQETEQAIANYQQAMDQAEAAVEPQTGLIAQLGLGSAYRLQAETYAYLGRDDQAGTLFDRAIQTILPTLGPMNAAGQHRYLAQAYLYLGTAYAQQARIRQDRGDVSGSIDLYRQAREAYANCAAQKEASPYDEILTQKIIAAACAPYDRVSQEALAVLEGGQ